MILNKALRARNVFTVCQTLATTPLCFTRSNTKCSETYSCNKAVEWLSLLDVFNCYWTMIIVEPYRWFGLFRFWR